MTRPVVLVSLVIVLVSLTALVKVDATPVTFYSDSTYYGNGAFTSYISVDSEVPQAVGFEFTSAYLHDVPIPTMMMMDGMPMGMGSFELDVPNELPVYSPFQSIEVVNSAPHAAPYNRTHLDIYFFFLNTDMRANNITAGTEPKACGPGAVSPDTYCRGIKAVPVGCCPSSYSNGGTVLSGVGGSMADALSPERFPATDPRHGPWVAAFSFLIFNGRITGYKMLVPYDAWDDFVTGARSAYCKSLRLPTIMPDPGYYPTGYCVSRNSAGYLRFEYNQFVHYNTVGCVGPAINTTSTCFIKPSTIPPTPEFIKHCTCH